MINFKRHTLDNGMRIIVHTDTTTPMAAVNMLYTVGSRNEESHLTGFAHLFEHLMFGGSKNIPNFDKPVDRVGGESNAYTTCDITNYYITLPANNIETAFWLESDRLLELDFSEESLEVQRKVVMEEFKQRCLNSPYGDMMHLLRDLAYKVHPYRWPTIGLNLDHIANATLDDVKSFFYRNYAPDNAILSISGNVDADEMFRLAEKWFAPISRRAERRAITPEPTQTEQRTMHVERDVPADFLTIMYHMGDNLTREYYACDILTDILADGPSSRLVQRMTKTDKLMSDVNAYISGSEDPGMLSFTGTLLPGVSMEQAEKAFREEIDKMIQEGVSDYELQKVKNRREATNIFREMVYTAKATSLAKHEMHGDANLINTEDEIYSSITKEEIQNALSRIARKENESVLYYHAKQQ